MQIEIKAGVIIFGSVDGQLIENLHVEMAEDILAKAKLSQPSL